MQRLNRNPKLYRVRGLDPKTQRCCYSRIFNLRDHALRKVVELLSKGYDVEIEKGRAKFELEGRIEHAQS